MGFLVLLLLGVGLVWGPLQKYRQVNRARQALLESQPERALDALQSLNADRPNDAQINYLLARAYRRTGNLKQAQSHLEQAQRSGWSSEEVNQQRHLALLQSGQIQETAAFFKRLLNQGVSDEIAVEFYEAQAMALLHGYRFKEAMVCLNYWIDWRPQDVRPRMWRGEIWDRILYHKDAIREYSSVLEVAPDHLDARRHLAKSLFESHKFEQALEHYQQCTQIDSSDTEARIGVAQCNLRLLNIDVAEQQLRALLQVDLNDDQRTRVAIVLATLVLDKKQPQEAIRILDDLKGLAKTNPEALYVLGRAYNQTGDSAKGSK